MGYDIRLVDPMTGKTIKLKEKHYFRGGTYEIGGTYEAWLNVTYNYSKWFSVYINREKGIRYIYGMTGKESLPILQKAIQQISLVEDIEYSKEEKNDYWTPTKENVLVALNGLFELAKLWPNGILEGD